MAVLEVVAFIASSAVSIVSVGFALVGNRNADFISVEDPTV